MPIRALTAQNADGLHPELLVGDPFLRELPYGNANADAIHAAHFGARAMLEFDGADTDGTHNPYALQPAEFSTRSRTWIAQAGSLVPLVYGFPAAAVTAGAGTTITARVPTTADLFSGSSRLALATATTVGSMAQWRGMAPYFYQGSTLAKGGGWFMAARFGFSAITAGARIFVGMSATQNITNVEPNTLVNSFGIGCLAADTNLKIMSCGAAASADVIDTGLAKSTLNQWIDIILSAPAGATKLGYAFRRGGYGATWVKGTIAAGKMPAQDTMLSPSVWSSNGTTAAALALEISHVYCETDY